MSAVNDELNTTGTNVDLNADSSQFKWITSEYSDIAAFIAVDSQLRLYFNTATRKLLNESCEVQIGYDFANRRIVVAPSDVVRPVNVRPHRIDGRGYASARHFVRQTGLTRKELPLRYTYLGRDFTEYPRGAYVFGREGETGEDGAL